jgi:hypothetical protein
MGTSRDVRSRTVTLLTLLGAAGEASVKTAG